MAANLAKGYSETYLYHMNNMNYEKELVQYIMKAEEIDKSDSSFEDIRFDVKRRQISNSLLKVLDSKNVKLMKYVKPLPKSFKVFVAKDIKGDKQLKVFIDADVIHVNGESTNGIYKCSNIDILISYLVSGMNALIYYSDPKRLVMNSTIISTGTESFAGLFTNIVDYLYKISTMTNVRDKCLYLSAMYFQINILRKDVTDTVKHLCRKISGLSEREEQLLLLQLPKDAFLNIKFFVEAVSKVLRLSKLTIDVFVEKWIYLYGVGTQFALEVYPAFATMLTNCYVGAYINNQKTIEKITGRKMTEFTSEILRIGSELVK